MTPAVNPATVSTKDVEGTFLSVIDCDSSLSMAKGMFRAGESSVS